MIHKDQVVFNALKIDGTLVMTICLEGAENFDWEAIATAPCSKM